MSTEKGFYNDSKCLRSQLDILVHHRKKDKKKKELKSDFSLIV